MTDTHSPLPDDHYDPYDQPYSKETQTLNNASLDDTTYVPPQGEDAPAYPAYEDEGAYPEEENNDEQSASKKKWIWIGVIVGLIALVIASVFYAVYYHDKALPGTYIGDKNVAGMTQKEVTQLVSSQQKDIKLAFSSDYGSSTVSLDEAGLTMDPAKTAKKVFDAKSFGSYLTAPLMSTHTTPVYEVDPKQVQEIASTKHLSKDVPGAIDAKNFEVVANKEGTFVIQDGKPGKGFSPKDVKATAEKAAKTLSDASKKLAVTEVTPLITKEKLARVLDEANKMVDSKVSLRVGDDSVTADKVQKASWIVIPKDPEEHPKTDEKKVKAWVEEQAKPLVKEPQNGKVYVSQAGKVLLEKPKPVDGQDVSNIDSVSKTITQKVASAEAVDSKFETKVVKAESEKKVIADGAEKLAYLAGPNEKWIDINLSNATVTPYIGATKQAGPLGMVSGKPSTPTVTGTFKVWHKTASQTMEGDNGDGTRYKVDNVRWNTFFHAGYAMHGAPWQGVNLGRPGGNRISGSHGCVNMSVEGARIIYNFAPIGTVVVSHY